VRSISAIVDVIRRLSHWILLSPVERYKHCQARTGVDVQGIVGSCLCMGGSYASI
jgi:hypothetical protein